MKPVHYWTKTSGKKARCHRAFLLLTEGEGYAKVLIVGEGPSYAAVVERNRLKDGWNNWHDPEGRPFLPEGTWDERGYYHPPKEKP